MPGCCNSKPMRLSKYSSRPIGRPDPRYQCAIPTYEFIPCERNCGKEQFLYNMPLKTLGQTTQSLYNSIRNNQEACKGLLKPRATFYCPDCHKNYKGYDDPYSCNDICNGITLNCTSETQDENGKRIIIFDFRIPGDEAPSTKMEAPADGTALNKDDNANIINNEIDESKRKNSYVIDTNANFDAPPPINNSNSNIPANSKASQATSKISKARSNRKRKRSLKKGKRAEVPITSYQLTVQNNNSSDDSYEDISSSNSSSGVPINSIENISESDSEDSFDKELQEKQQRLSNKKSKKKKSLIKRKKTEVKGSRETDNNSAAVYMNRIGSLTSLREDTRKSKDDHKEKKEEKENQQQQQKSREYHWWDFNVPQPDPCNNNETATAPTQELQQPITINCTWGGYIDNNQNENCLKTSVQGSLMPCHHVFGVTDQDLSQGTHPRLGRSCRSRPTKFACLQRPADPTCARDDQGCLPQPTLCATVEVSQEKTKQAIVFQPVICKTNNMSINRCQ